MDNKELIQRLVNFEEEKKTTQESSKTQKYPRKNELFDLDKISKDVLDRGWKDYGPYVFNIDHRNAFANRVIESTNYEQHVQDVLRELRNTLPISKEQIEDIDDYDFSKLDVSIASGHHGMFAILVSGIRKNPEIVEMLLERKGFFRSQPTDKQMNAMKAEKSGGKPKDKLYEILEDPEGRPWYVMRFEPIDPDDVTEEVHAKYKFLYHLSPSYREKDILEKGLLTSNKNSTYRYSEPRVYMIEGDSDMSDFQKLADTLYEQVRKDAPNPTPEYTLFAIDLEKVSDDFKFYYDINEPKGIYSKQDIPPEYLKVYKRLTARTNYKIPNKKK